MYSPDFLSTPTMLQGRGFGGGLGRDSSTSLISFFDLDASKLAALSPMIEEELCLIFSGAFSGPVSQLFTSAWKLLGFSGLKSVVGEVKLLARPVELNTQSLLVKQNIIRHDFYFLF